MTCRHQLRANLSGLTLERTELDVLIAVDARIRRKTLEIAVGEFAYYRLRENIPEVKNEMGNPDYRRHPPRVVDRPRRAAILASRLVRLIGPDVEREAYDVVSLLTEQRGSDRAVDSAAHGYGDSWLCDFCAVQSRVSVMLNVEDANAANQHTPERFQPLRWRCGGIIPRRRRPDRSLPIISKGTSVGLFDSGGSL